MGLHDEILIEGDGVAARCCQHLLQRAGLNVVAHRGERPMLPAIMLAESALSLMRDVFGNSDLLREAPRIAWRTVAWGEGAETVTLPHSGVVVSERVLLGSLGLAPDGSANAAARWTVCASRPLPVAVEEHPFGSRRATALAVNLKSGARAETCWIESLADGWLFLIPDCAASGWLLSVGGEPGAMLGRSRLVAQQLESVGSEAGAFPAYPRIVWPLHGTGWIACGTAAMAFDPICGDGTANAIREAILASAVIRAAASGGNVEALLRHYEARLTAGFARHLELCGGFYRSGGSGPWWARERDSVERGVAWCAEQARRHGEFRYRLNGFELEAR